MGLLRELLPTAARVAVLVNPSDMISDLVVKDAQAAASIAGLGLVVFTASTPHEIDAAFASLAQDRADALFCRSEQKKLAIGPGDESHLFRS